MNAPEEMIVATVLGWVWRDLSDGVDGRWPVRRDLGIEVPELTSARTAWWTPTGHAARLVAAGLELQLTATGPGWLARLARLDRALTGRRIESFTLGDALDHLADLPPGGFLKPTLAKLEALEAAWYTDLPGALTAAAAAGVHRDTVLELTDVRLDIAEEYRTFVLDGRASRPSPYRIAGQSWEPEFDTRDDVPIDAAHAFAGAVAAGLAADRLAPRAYVLDVARLTDGRYVVLETNAAWSSGTYGCDLRDVADAAAAASTPPTDPRWRWQPDPTELADAYANPLPDRRASTPLPSTVDEAAARQAGERR